MRWRVRISKRHQVGDITIRSPFAWWPIRIGGFMVWLERYGSVVRCTHVYGKPFGAIWTSEYIALDQISALDYVNDNYISKGYHLMQQPHVYRNLRVRGDEGYEPEIK